MGVGYALGTVVLAVREYENWAEVIAATAKRQEPTKVILKGGLKIEAEVGLRFQVREIFFKRIYNPPYFPIEGNDIVVDIGANNGIFTLFAASITRNTVHAFEPSPGCLEVLERNIAINDLSHVITHGCAVSDKVGSARLLLNATDSQQNLLADHIVPDKIEECKLQTDLNRFVLQTEMAEAYIEVPTTTLQEVMDSNDLERIDFLKLNCEGAEGPILHATPNAYLKRIKKIAMGFHDYLSEFSHSDIQKLLEEAGFVTRLKWHTGSLQGRMYAWRD